MIKLRLQSKFPISRFIVRDKSMETAYFAGDRVMTFNFGGFKAGDVIVFKANNTYFIKRIRKIEKDFIIAISDNKSLAEKVWTVNRKDIVGKVLLKY